MSRTRAELSAFGLAVRLLTRWPLPRHRADPAADPASSAAAPPAAQSSAAVAWYPLVGMLIGGFAGVVFFLAHLVFPVVLAVVLAAAATLLATGALHEDGFADACDGLGGGATRERALEIMRDPRLGTYGTAGLGLLFAAKVLALAAAPATVIPWLLVAGHAASRASMALALASGTHARPDGIAAPLAEGSPAGSRLAFAALIGGAVSCTLLIAAPLAALLAGLCGLLLGHLLMRRAYERKLGGFTGDCLGAVQQASELGMYLGVLAALRL